MTSSKFILVKHEATKRGLHYDLRFKMPNSQNWASFAMNSEPPKEVGERKYITRTTDHSRENALFTGRIPEGEYGAGKLTKIDSGNCDVEKFTSSHMIVVFHGKKLQGKYNFINVGVFNRRDYKKRVFAFFKSKD
jgi:bifunctional non-homologous end joining protein LigD